MCDFANSRLLAPLPASSLRRSGSYLSLPDLRGTTAQPVPSPYSVHNFIANQEKRFRISREPKTKGSHPSLSNIRLTTSSYDVHRQRTSSPLAPRPQLLPPRPEFPRSKPEPDLYKLAITTHMRSSHERMCTGSPLTMALLNATRELEGLVAAQSRDNDGDIIIADGPSNSPWLVISSKEWDMVET